MKKIVVITGASSGMGKATALYLQKQGYTVYGLARRLERMHDLKALGGHPMKLDVTDFDEIKEVIKTIIHKEGRIDVLWNNAGYDVMGAVEDVSLEDAKRQMDVNLFGLSEMTKACLPHMRKNNSGLIINTSSVGGKIFSPLNAWYHASKHAVEGFSDSLRMEANIFGIDVVVLEPGVITTEFTKVMMEPVKERSKGSAYQPLLNSLLKTFDAQMTGQSSRHSDPIVVAKQVEKIILSDKPKTRYPVGSMARTFLFMRWFLSDKAYQRLVMTMTAS